MKILKFSATWCHPCQQLAKVLEGMKPYFEEKGVEFKEYDIEEDVDLTEEYGIRSVPTLIFKKDNDIVGKTIGMTTENKIKEIIENNL